MPIEDELSLIINEVPLRGYFVGRYQDEKRFHHEHLISSCRGTKGHIQRREKITNVTCNK
jgi:hypothetical protein